MGLFCLSIHLTLSWHFVSARSHFLVSHDAHCARWTRFDQVNTSCKNVTCAEAAADVNKNMSSDIGTIQTELCGNWCWRLCHVCVGPGLFDITVACCWSSMDEERDYLSRTTLRILIFLQRGIALNVILPEHKHSGTYSLVVIGQLLSTWFKCCRTKGACRQQSECQSLSV